MWGKLGLKASNKGHPAATIMKATSDHSAAELAVLKVEEFLCVSIAPECLPAVAGMAEAAEQWDGMAGAEGGRASLKWEGIGQGRSEALTLGEQVALHKALLQHLGVQHPLVCHWRLFLSCLSNMAEEKRPGTDLDAVAEGGISFRSCSTSQYIEYLNAFDRWGQEHYRFNEEAQGWCSRMTRARVHMMGAKLEGSSRGSPTLRVGNWALAQPSSLDPSKTGNAMWFGRIHRIILYKPEVKRSGVQLGVACVMLKVRGFRRLIWDGYWLIFASHGLFANPVFLLANTFRSTGTRPRSSTWTMCPLSILSFGHQW